VEKCCVAIRSWQEMWKCWTREEDGIMQCWQKWSFVLAGRSGWACRGTVTVPGFSVTHLF